MNKNINLESYLVKHMWKIIFWLWIIIFLTWLIPLINLPTWWIINNIFWIEQVKQIISTQYMFTTLWAIFAFWYWYKRYERDKELEFLNKISELKQEDNFEQIIIKWSSMFFLNKKLYISDILFKIIKNHFELLFIRNIVKEENTIKYKISETLLYFEYNKYIKDILVKIKENRKNDKDFINFVNEIKKLEKNNWNKTN